MTHMHKFEELTSSVILFSPLSQRTLACGAVGSFIVSYHLKHAHSRSMSNLMTTLLAAYSVR